MALLLGFLPHVILEDDWHQEEGKAVQANLPKPQTPVQTQVSAPSPFSLAWTLHSQMAPTIGAIPNQREDARR